jgi:GNAT superfamily N-acetyltransferase
MAGSLEVLPIAADDRASIRRFVDYGYSLYRGEALKVPALSGDLAAVLGRRSRFFDKGEAESFLALVGGRTVGRLTVYEDRAYNSYHRSREARFCWFEAGSPAERPGTGARIGSPEGAGPGDVPETTAALFGAAEAWARGRGLAKLRGPYAIAGLEGAGLLVEGFDRPQTMTMSPWNPPTFPGLLEGAGFVPFKELVSAEIETAKFTLPDRVSRVAERIRARGRFAFLRLRGVASVLRLVPALGDLYTRSFAEHDDFMPLSPEDFVELARGLAVLTMPDLIKILAYDGRPAGFLFAFPDLSAALRRAKGRLSPWNLLDLALEKGRTRRLVVNGAGVDPERQRLGGNALLYTELERLVRERGYEAVEMVQIASSNGPMIADMETLGGRVVKRHRLYSRDLL